jgi:hypothetical protein
MLVLTLTHLHTVRAGEDRITAFRDARGMWTINGARHLTFNKGTASILDVTKSGVRVGFRYQKDVKIVR